MPTVLRLDTGAVSHLILFDVWHHLEYPGTALREFYRVLAERGKVIIFDPAMGVLGRFVFGNFHHEPLGLGEEIRWEAPAGSISADFGYYAAQGNASRVFGSSAFREQLRSWRVAEVSYFSGLAYLGSGGFRGPQLYPMAALPLLNRVDTFLSRFPQPCFADAGGAGKAARSWLGKMHNGARGDHGARSRNSRFQI